MKSPRRLAPSPPPDPRGVELPLGLVVSPDGKRAIHHALVVGDTTFTRVRVWNLAKGTSTTRDLGADLMAV
ncbi:MAG TPA: hypothetical protein VK427_02185, partial [Kofleriaceae bacterium]|nr:hypothetical protein [Kofleriaceae bacterium]